MASKLSEWWCKLFHSHSHWTHKKEYVYGDAGHDEWLDEYVLCTKCMRKYREETD